MARFRPLVLCYHAVSSSWEHALAVDAGAFERQLRLVLARRFRPVDAATAAAGGARLLHVTFDDAFANVRDVLPVLERLRVPATVFACSAFADDGGAVFDVPELAGEAAAHPAEMRTMGWDELRDLLERGHEVGSHTASHPHLTRLSDDELDRELRESRERLEERLGRPCRWLAYPYGDEDARVRDAARRAGYDGAFALPGVDRPYDPFGIPRVGVYRRDGLVRTALKTTAAVRRPAAAVTARRNRRARI